jgi:hypothetical protein
MKARPKKFRVNLKKYVVGKSYAMNYSNIFAFEQPANEGEKICCQLILLFSP